jgi:cathepsin B
LPWRIISDLTIITMIGILFVAAVFAESVVEIVNNDPRSTWVAVEYHPSIITHAKMVARLGAIPAVTRNSPYVPDKALPTDFNPRDKWGEKIIPIRDQAHCGSCWAFSVTTAFTDRANIAGRVWGTLSPQDLVSCDKTNYGCQGGYMDKAYDWTKDHGLATDKCMPYTSGSGRVPACPQKCDDGSAITRHKIKDWKVVKGEEIQKELFTLGPCGVDFQVYSDFMNYKSGVYQHKSGFLEGGHAVVLLGWGVEGGVPYWLVQNSWGTSWGEAGHFKIIRGRNECNIENDVIAVEV